MYTIGKRLENDHNEIHLSTDCISSVEPPLLKNEITGVIAHEMLHCWQWIGCGSAPGGLTEGIADWVRLKADLETPQWMKSTEGGWNVGYQITAWFLDWLEDKYGSAPVSRLNLKLKDKEYQQQKYWNEERGRAMEGVQGLV